MTSPNFRINSLRQWGVTANGCGLSLRDGENILKLKLSGDVLNTVDTLKSLKRYQCYGI